MHLPTLAGAIIGGATFGDCIAPVSDTTIATALSQDADIGGTVRTRLKYVLPAAALALLFYAISAGLQSGDVLQLPPEFEARPLALVMIVVPVVIIYMLLKRKHLFYGLFSGLVAGILVGLLFGLLPQEKLLSLDLDNFRATSFIIDGMNRAVGISFFTILLMGLMASVKASGLLEKLADISSKKIDSARQAESWISGSVGLVVLVVPHSVVAVLTAAEFVRQAGEQMQINKYRRANLMGLVVCTFPFILPYYIPVILTSNATMSGADFGIASVNPLDVGLYNFFSWSLMLVTVFIVISGLGRNRLPATETN